MTFLVGLLLLVFGQGVSPVIHSLEYFYTGSSGLSSFPECVAVGMLDGVQMFHYDSISKRAEPKQAWMDQVTRDDPDYWERETKRVLDFELQFKDIILPLKQHFNQTGGAHIVQRMYGCEWDDEDGSVCGYDQYGYDGEDFIKFDLENLRWISSTHQAFSIRLRLDQNKTLTEYLKNYLTKECVDWLKKYLDYGKNTFQRTERPQVSLLQRTPSSPVGCHATGFYPDRVLVFWTRDGEEVSEGGDHGRVLPNHDGTFQVSVDLNLTSVPKEDWGRYQCVVQLKGIEDLFTPLDPARIRTNWGKTGLERDGAEEHQSGITTTTIIIITGSVVLLLASAAAVGLVLYMRNGSDGRTKTTEEQNPAPEALALTTGIEVES